MYRFVPPDSMEGRQGRIGPIYPSLQDDGASGGRDGPTGRRSARTGAASGTPIPTVDAMTFRVSLCLTGRDAGHEDGQ